MIDKTTCIYNLYSDAVSVTKDLDTDSYKAFDKDNKEITIDMSAVDAEFTKQDYQNKRISEYPSIQNQLDMQYWDAVNGTTTWKDAIAKVKSDNPKPS